MLLVVGVRGPEAAAVHLARVRWWPHSRMVMSGGRVWWTSRVSASCAECLEGAGACSWHIQSYITLQHKGNIRNLQRLSPSECVCDKL